MATKQTRLTPFGRKVRKRLIDKNMTQVELAALLGCNKQYIYVLEEGETILSLNKYGDLWEAETIAIPWIHHSQEVEVQHSKYSGIVTVEKTIVRSDDTGAVHMYIYFAGGEKDV